MTAVRDHVVMTLEALLSEFALESRMKRMVGDVRGEEIAERRTKLVLDALEVIYQSEAAA